MNRLGIVLLAASVASILVRGDEAPKAAAERPSLAGESFFVGCNYWASHAGMYMWRDWNPRQVESDLDRLAAHGMTVLRVFPLWPDFQPLTAEFGGGGSFHGYAQSGGPLKNYAAVDDAMLERFRFLCDAADRRGIRLVVGLVTGWMSGRMFAPPALERMNVVTDAEAIVWQCRFVRYFVSHLRDHRAIAAWDLGNECNCMGGATAAQLWTWMHAVAAEIRLADPSRPVVSGMHSVSTRADASTNMRQQGELTDFLTTHPYPLWTPDCNEEPFDTIRNGCHPACETTLYAALAKTPAFVEEAGSMGPQIVSEERAARTMRMQLFSSWAAGVPGFVWWCGFDQNRLAFAPYEWTAIERELGLFTADGEPKPTARTMKEFADFLKKLPISALPPRRVDAVVLVSEVEDFWKQALGAWILSREAGFDITYCSAEEELPESDFYILPSGGTYNTYSGRAFGRVLARAERGATLLITLGNGAILSGLEGAAGIRTETHHRGSGVRSVRCPDGEFALGDSHVRRIIAVDCETLATDADGSPVLTEHRLGAGRVLFFNGALESNAAVAGWPAYRLAAARAGVRRVVRRAEPRVGLTEHRAGDRIYVVAVNYAPEPIRCPLEIDGTLGRVFRGKVTAGELALEANEAAVFEVLGAP